MPQSSVTHFHHIRYFQINFLTFCKRRFCLKHFQIIQITSYLIFGLFRPFQLDLFSFYLFAIDVLSVDVFASDIFRHFRYRTVFFRSFCFRCPRLRPFRVRRFVLDLFVSSTFCAFCKNN